MARVEEEGKEGYTAAVEVVEEDGWENEEEAVII